MRACSKSLLAGNPLVSCCHSSLGKLPCAGAILHVARTPQRLAMSSFFSAFLLFSAFICMGTAMAGPFPTDELHRSLYAARKTLRGLTEGGSSFNALETVAQC